MPTGAYGGPPRWPASRTPTRGRPSRRPAAPALPRPSGAVAAPPGAGAGSPALVPPWQPPRPPSPT
eukprot:1446672-Lingulodinium_polyedra.AAC.1